MITGNTGKGSGDSSQFAPLLAETAETFPVGIVVGNGAHPSRDAVSRVRDVGRKPWLSLPLIS